MGNEIFETVFRFGIIALICVGILIALRAAVLWYWKIDRVVELLEAQNAILKAILKKEEKERVIAQIKSPSLNGRVGIPHPTAKGF